MVILIAAVLTALAIQAEARRPRIEMYELRLDPSSSEDREDPILKRITEVPKSNSGAAQIARHLVEQIDLLLAEPEPNRHNNDDEESSGSNSREAFIDKTRSSLVLVPADGDSVYHIVTDSRVDNGILKACAHAAQRISHCLWIASSSLDVVNVRELKQKQAVQQGMPVLPWVIAPQKGDNENRLGNKKQKRIARSPQWDVIIGNHKTRGFG